MFRRYAAGPVVVLNTSGPHKKVGSCVVHFAAPCESDSGVSHVLEHVVCRNTVEGQSLLTLQTVHPDLRLNGETDSRGISFVFDYESPSSLHEALWRTLAAATSANIPESLFRTEGFWIDPRDLVDEISPRWRGVVFNEMIGQYARNAWICRVAVRQALFAGTPDQYDAGGHPRHIARLSFNELHDFRRRHLVPQSCTVVHQGPADADTVINAINQGIAWKDPNAQSDITIFSKYRARRSQYVSKRHELSQQAVEPEVFAIKFWSPRFEQPDSLVNNLLLHQVWDRLHEAAELALSAHLSRRLRLDCSGMMPGGNRSQLILAMEEQGTVSQAVGEQQLIKLLTMILTGFLNTSNTTEVADKLFVELRNGIEGTAAGLARTMFGSPLGCNPRNASHLVEGVFERIEESIDHLRDPSRLHERIKLLIDCMEVTRVPLRLGNQLSGAYEKVSQRLWRYLQRNAERSSARFVSVLTIARPSESLALSTAPEEFGFSAPRATAQQVPQPSRNLGQTTPIYCQRFINLSAMSTVSHSMLPLMARVLENRIKQWPATSRCSLYLYAQALANGAGRTALAVAKEFGKAEAALESPLHILNKAIASFITEPPKDDEVRRAARDLLSSTTINPVPHCLYRDPVDWNWAAQAVWLWKGSAVLSLAHSLVTSKINCQNIIEGLVNCASVLATCPSVRYTVFDDFNRDDVLTAIEVDKSSMEWPDRSLSLEIDKDSYINLESLSEWPTLTSEQCLTARVPIDLSNIKQVASMLILAPCLDSNLIKPSLRDDLGSYHAAINIDTHLGECYVICIRPPNASEAADRLLKLNWDKAVTTICDAEYTASQHSFQYRRGKQSRPLASLLRDTTESLLGVTEFGVNLEVAASRMNLAEAKDCARTLLNDRRFTASMLTNS